MKVVDIADEIYRELNFPTDLSIPSISFWVRTNIGSLNNLINTSYYIDLPSLEILQVPPGETSGTEEIKENEKVILKKMYFVHYFERKIKENLGVGQIDQIIEISSDGMKVRKTSKSDIVKNISIIKEQEFSELEKMVHFYKINQSSPRQVTGDDTIEGSYLSSGRESL